MMHTKIQIQIQIKSKNIWRQISILIILLFPLLKADTLTQTQLHATMGIVTNFILSDNKVTHNGTDYNRVTSPHTGRVWLDRNLGASRVCLSLSDSQCYGDYYQWGRNPDGHEKTDSEIYITLATDVNNVGHDFFIKQSNSPYDWASVDSSGEIRQDNWSKTDGTGVCPLGFRVPTKTEVEAEFPNVGLDILNDDVFNSFLKLPSAGRRSLGDYPFSDVGTTGYLWTSSPDYSSGSTFKSSYYFTFSPDYSAGAFGSYRAFGSSVRCIQKMPEEHYHNGTVYGVVTSPYTGKVWLDRNLGAQSVCKNHNDTQCYGDYYQWGRAHDGHQYKYSSTTSTLIGTATHENFVTNTNAPYDWKTQDDLGFSRETFWSKTDGTGVCPLGFRVPTESELAAELLNTGSAEIQSHFDAFNSFLKLPSSGYRNTNGSMSALDTWGAVWSSTTNTYLSKYLNFYHGYANLNQIPGRVSGHGVRCIRD